MTDKVKEYLGRLEKAHSISTQNSSYYDTIYANHFNRFRVPQNDKLVELYRRNIFTCANINANGCTRIPLRLYVKTARNDEKTKLVTKSLNPVTRLKLIKGNPTLRSTVDIEEVVEHPAIDLLKTVNDSGFINGYYLALWTYLYMDVCGSGYWLIRDNAFGIPEEIWLVPSQYIEPVRLPNSKKIVDFYRVHNRNKQKTEIYQPHEVISFNNPDLTDPYVSGLGALSAAYEDNTIANQMVAHQESYLENEARPDLMITPKDSEASFGGDVAKRYEKELMLRYGKGRGGGIYVGEEPMDVKEISTPPRDLARLEIPDKAKEQIANAFDVPISLLQNKTVNKATLEAALTQHALMGVSPRLTRVASILNSNYLTRWDTSGRLFFEYDNPVPEDREVKLQENVQLKQTGIITANEARDNYNYPPHPDGDELEAINASSEMKREDKRATGEAEK